MADFTTNLTGVAQLDDRLIKLYSNQFIISAADTLTKGLDSVVTINEQINAKSISFTKYSKLSLATTALNEREEVTSAAMSDSEVLLTPAEYGNVVTLTALADLQSGGMAAQAAFRLAGINARETQEKLLILAAEASSNEIIVNQSAESSLTASDVMTRAYVDRAYNKLARAGVPKLEGGTYIAIAHEDVIYDIKNSASAGEWTDLNKYSSGVSAFSGEVGMFRGFRFISSPLVSVNADAGSTTVDTYHTMFLGFNALGKAVSMPVQPKVTGPFDKLGRFVNIGWHGVFAYGIVDQDALWIVTSASSIGSN